MSFLSDDLERSQQTQQEMFDQIIVLLRMPLNLVMLRWTGAMEHQFECHDAIIDQWTQRTTGFTSERQLWLDVIVRNNAGTVLFSSGQLDSYGDLYDSHSWEVAADPIRWDDNWLIYSQRIRCDLVSWNLTTTETVFQWMLIIENILCDHWKLVGLL